LIALNLLNNVEMPRSPYDPRRWHYQIEAMKLAFDDAFDIISDPEHCKKDIHSYLIPDYGKKQSLLIGKNAANVEPEKKLDSHNTVSFVVVDNKGNACSWIQSIFYPFGSGIYTDFGFTLQNRGHCFSLQGGHPNELAPRKRPYHTIIPGMATKNGDLFAPFSVMGGYMQPQGHVQIISNMVDYAMDPQNALDFPRFCIDPFSNYHGKPLVFHEDNIPPGVIEELQKRGHPLKCLRGLSDKFGRGQIIVSKNTVLWGGSDGRGDGCCAIAV